MHATKKTRYVTTCQQLLVLAVVLAALVPAASVVSLDVVGESPAATGSGSHHERGGRVLGGAEPVADLAAYTREAAKPSLVPTAPIAPVVREVSMTARPGARIAAGSLHARVATARRGRTVITSTPQAVHGFGTVGVTWAHGDDVPEAEIAFTLRTEKDGVWMPWESMDYHDDHGPDPGSREAQGARPGTDESLVGHVEAVQVRGVSTRALPTDMTLAVIDPGTPVSTRPELAAIDTARLDPDTGTAPDTELAGPTTGPTIDQGAAPGARLSAAVFTPKPVIYSRAQWGADESLRDKPSLHYGEVHAGFVHHTVNANDYTRAEVPAIIRSIYAYHVESRGWSDIGYNFLVDKFGRIWEGRYGGVDRPVVGAHTLGFNEDSFAMSAIGNYDIAATKPAMIQAYGALFGWKLSLHGVDAASTHQYVTSRWFEAINGHKDDGEATACPGRYLYAKLPQIRKLAARAQRGWSGRQLESNLAGTPHPDLIVRRKSDGQGVILPTQGLSGFDTPVVGSSGWASASQVVASPDLTGDGRADVLETFPNGTAEVRAGNGLGGFRPATRTLRGFSGHDLVTAVGDLNGDGDHDLVARDEASGGLDVYLGGGSGGFTRVRTAGTAWGTYDLISGVGDVTGDGHADLVARDAAGRLWLYAGTGTTHFATRRQVPGAFAGYDTITGLGDYDADGHADLLVRNAHTGKGYVLPGRGNGTFEHPLGPYPRLKGLTGITGGGQVMGDARPDLVARVGGRLVVVVDSGHQDLGRPIATGMDLSSADLVLDAGDWNRDGHDDVITRNATTGSLYLHAGNGTGRFGAATRIATGFGKVTLLAAVGDMTGDGWPDLMGQAPNGGPMRIYPGAGAAGLKAGYPAYGTVKAGAQIPVGLWNGDGAPDSLFRSGNDLLLYPGNGPGGLTGRVDLKQDLSAYDWVVGVSSLTLTGHPDLIVRARRTGYLYELPATGSGFGERRYLGEGMEAYDLVG